MSLWGNWAAAKCTKNVVARATCFFGRFQPRFGRAATRQNPFRACTALRFARAAHLCDDVPHGLS